MSILLRVKTKITNVTQNVINSQCSLVMDSLTVNLSAH